MKSALIIAVLVGLAKAEECPDDNDGYVECFHASAGEGTSPQQFMDDFDDNTDCEILETIDTCIESLDCDKPEMFDVFAEEEHSHCDDGDHDDECHCTESCGETDPPEDCAGMKVFLEEDGCAHSCLADPEDIEHCLEDFHAQLCTEGETGYFAIDEIEYHDEEDGGDHDGHDHGDEDEDEFSGSIASSSASVLAFGASFLLGWAQQQ